MSKIKTRKDRLPAAAKMSPMSPAKKWLLFLCLFVIIVTTLPIFVILLIGMLPTITIMMTDAKNTNKLIIVGGFNMAGVFIYLMNIINHFSVREAFFILSDVFNLIIMLGSAAIGLVIYCELPNLFIFISKASAKKRLKQIDEKLEKLGQDWGSELIYNKINDVADKKKGA